MYRKREEELRRVQEAVAENCREAADAIAGAEVLLLCTGAGFSADSGLAVYADVARIDAYAERGLKYHDICQPCWLDSEPELFWGFWGQCFNDYRETPPHDGYSLIEGWVEQCFRTSDAAEEIRATLREQVRAGRFPHLGQLFSGSAYTVQEHAGAFFVFTSNVDAHHFDWFRAHEIHECHGNTEIYQCTKQHCDAVWRAPLDFRFRVDQATMLAPASPPALTLGPAPAEAEAEPTEEEAAGPAAAEAEAEPTSASEDDGAQAAGVEDAQAAGVEDAQAAGVEDAQAAGEARAPRIGQVRGGGRPRLLRYMPAGETSSVGFGENHPRCPTCGFDARPAILMFGDWQWRDDGAQETRFRAWSQAVQHVASRRAESPAGPLRVAILEIGAGDNVPTVRHTSESTLFGFLRAGADARLIRVNPAQPLGDSMALLPGGEHHARLVSIMARGLASIRSIDEAVQARRQSQEEPREEQGAADCQER